MNAHATLAQQVDEGRLAAQFARLATVTATPGCGITRLAFSPEDAQARALVTEWMHDAGLEVRVDAAANIIGRLPGETDQPVVMTGSHLDSVPQGGNFDGVVGVLGAIEAVRALRAAGTRTTAPIEVVCFASEEAPRFSQAGHRFGSRVMAGVFDTSLVSRLQDDDGVTLAEALSGFGCDPERLGEASRSAGEIAAMVEMHIEQGDGLVGRDASVGVVSCITGTTRFRVFVDGEAAHSGGMPMRGRRDALAAASEMVLAVEGVATSQGGTVVATVGTMSAEPGSISVVPGRAVFGVDVRDIDSEAKNVAVRAIRGEIASIASARGVTVTLDEIRDDPPVECATRLREVIRAAADTAGIEYADVASHTGHDAASLSDLTDVGMIFVRNRSGKSHSVDEDVAISDIAQGTRVLAETLARLAGSKP
jgi:hydantoinase/carbamoylase family amidase